MHPDLSHPAAQARRDRLLLGAEHRRALRTIGRRPRSAAFAVAAKILPLRRWAAKDRSRIALEQCPAIHPV